MPRPSRKAQLKEQQDPAALALFDWAGLPERHDWVQAIVRGTYKHTGARLTDDDRKCLALVDLLQRQRGIKRIARELGVSANTVRAARNALVATGQLEPYKQRLVAIYEDATEALAMSVRDAAEEGSFPVTQAPVAAAIFHDKRAQALGEATSVSVGVRVEAPISVEALNRFMEPPIDCQSTVYAPVSEGKQPLSATLSVTPPLLAPGNPPPGSEPRPEPDPASVAPVTTPPGGGPEAGAGGTNPTDSVSEPNSAKRL